MPPSALVIRLVASVVLASPLTTVRKRQDTNTGVTWIYKSPSLPKVLLYNTGDGTILEGSDNGRLDNVNYGLPGAPGGLTPEALIQQTVPEVLDIAQITVRSTSAGGVSRSADADSSRAVNISMEVQELMCSPNSDIVGAVMIHGTNTLAETAFDGPFNFYDAIRTAIHPEARDRGTLIAFSDHLVPAFYGTKTNANTVSTFKAIKQGYIGQFLAGQPYFYFEPSFPKGRHYFDPTKLIQPLPKIDILYAHQNFDPGLMYAAAAGGAKGIVVMGSGPGTLSTNATSAAEDLFSQGVITVASLRPFFGASVPPPQPAHVISSGFMHCEQSRIQLQLALAAGYDFARIQKLFEEDIRDTVYNPATAFYHGIDL